MTDPEPLPQRRLGLLRPAIVVPWLVAAAALAALAVVVAGGLLDARPPARAAAAAPPARGVVLPPGAGAAAVSRAFGKMTPYQVQKDMGPSGGKAADCSIYSDGDLDDGANVTWAVTLCVVHPIAPVG